MASIVYRYRKLDSRIEEYLVEGAIPSQGNESFLLAAVNSERSAQIIAETFNKLALVADAMELPRKLRYKMPDGSFYEFDATPGTHQMPDGSTVTV